MKYYNLHGVISSSLTGGYLAREMVWNAHSGNRLQDDILCHLASWSNFSAANWQVITTDCMIAICNCHDTAYADSYMYIHVPVYCWTGWYGMRPPPLNNYVSLHLSNAPLLLTVPPAPVQMHTLLLKAPPSKIKEHTPSPIQSSPLPK